LAIAAALRFAGVIAVGFLTGAFLGGAGAAEAWVTFLSFDLGAGLVSSEVDMSASLSVSLLLPELPLLSPSASEEEDCDFESWAAGLLIIVESNSESEELMLGRC